MSNKILIHFLFYIIILCKTLSNCQTLKTNSSFIQWSHWPSGQSSVSQWPNTKWNASQWPGARPPSLRPPHAVNTIYPPLPAGIWPEYPKPTPVIHNTPPPAIVSTEEDITSEPTEAPPTEKSTERPTQRPTQRTTQRPTQKTTRRPVPTNKPQTEPTVRPTVPSQPTDEASKINIKSCGQSHVPHEFDGNKIVSGKVAKSGEFPWQVILKINTARGNMQCGGAILNSRWILTAAHCVSNERDGTPTAQRVDLTAGVHNRLQMSTGSQQRTADCVIQHESWRGQNGNFKNDIALLRIPSNKPIEITYEKGGNVNAICIPEKSMSEYNGKARIAGWGLTKDRGTPSDVLLYTDVSILPNDKCRQFQYPVPIADSMICQGVDRTAPCQGDSGGALIIPNTDKKGIQRMLQVGIVSFGPGQCANPKTPNAIYTKVSHFLSWVEKTIKVNEQRCNGKNLRTDEIEKVGDIQENESNSTLGTENNIFY